jgi:hypothetical protein
VLEESLADHQVRIGRPLVAADIGTDTIVVSSGWRRRQFVGIDIDSDHAETQPGFALRANQRVLTAADVINDRTGSHIAGHQVVDEIQVSIDAQLGGEQAVEAPRQAFLDAEALAEGCRYPAK